VITKIVNFWRHSWETDRKAFVAELISFILTVGASLTLAVTADQPDMRLVYPGFFLGSIAGLYGYYRRKLAWPMMLTFYFLFVNIFGFGVAMLWW